MRRATHRRRGGSALGAALVVSFVGFQAAGAAEDAAAPAGESSIAKHSAHYTLTLAEALSLALGRGPRLQWAQGNVEVAQAGVDGASRLLRDNPEISVEIGRRRRSAGSSVDYELRLEQTFEIGGQRALRQEGSTANLLAAQAHLDVERAALIATVRETFARALAASLRVEVETQAVQLAEASANVAAQRLDAGSANRLEVNAARVEAGKARRRARLAQQEHAVILADLSTALGLDPRQPLVLRGELGADDPVDPNPAPLHASASDEAVVARHPEVVEATQALEAARATARLANRRLIPSPRLGAVYSREEDAELVLGTLALPLPVFEQNQEERGVTTAAVRQAEITLRATQQRVESRLRLARDRLRHARAALADLVDNGLLAAAEENLTLMGGAYEAGKVDFLELLLMRGATLDARRDHIDALLELAAAEARYAEALGHGPSTVPPALSADSP